MGSVYSAYCRCGYSEEVTVGGTRRSFRENSSFPFFCDHCGLVSVNVAQLPDGKVVTNCPKCNAPACTQYGVPPVSVHDLRPLPWWRRWFRPSNVQAVDSNIAWRSREASEEGHRCPQCREMSMRFSRYPCLMFD